MTRVYAALYSITRFIHYITVATLLLFIWIIYAYSEGWQVSKPIEALSVSSLYTLTWLYTWILVVRFFNGCPFVYLEEFFAHKAWGHEQTYGFEDSFAYRIFLIHLCKNNS